MHFNFEQHYFTNVSKKLKLDIFLLDQLLCWDDLYHTYIKNVMVTLMHVQVYKPTSYLSLVRLNKYK